jgi:hypothetical protein
MPLLLGTLEFNLQGMAPEYSQVRNEIAELGPPLIATIYLLFREQETRREARS